MAYELSFKGNRFYIHKKTRIFGIVIDSKKIASFADAETAIKYFKSLTK